MRVSPPTLTNLSVAVEHAEVGHDDGDGESDDKDAAEGAERAHDEARPGLGHHVAVADGGHGDDGPPQPFRDALEVVLRVGVQPLGVVHEAGEDDHAEDEEEDEQRELLGARLESVDQDLEARRVTGELEEPQDPDDGEKLQDVGVVHLGEKVLQQHVRIETERGYKVDPVQERLQKDGHGRRNDESAGKMEYESANVLSLDEQIPYSAFPLPLPPASVS